MNKLHSRFVALLLVLAMTVLLAVPAAAEEQAPAVPTATVTPVPEAELDPNVPLTFALKFVADEATEEQLAYYGNWYADFELTLNKTATFCADSETADGYLSGQYDEWSENWISVPFTDVTLEANVTLKIMEYAASLMGQSGLKVTYNDVYIGVKEFDCGVFFTEEYLAANPDLIVTLSLEMYNPADETQSYSIGPVYTFYAAAATITDAQGEVSYYPTLEEAIAAAKDGDTVVLRNNAVLTEGKTITVNKNITVDLNGCTVTDGALTASDSKCVKTDGSKRIFSDHDQETLAAAVPATCTTDGLTEGKNCSHCGKVMVAQKIVPASHKLASVAAKAATCTATGNIAHYVCEACGRLYSDANGKQEITAEAIVVKLKEHTYGTGVQATAPTCEKTGVMTYTCTADGCGHTKSETIDAAGHKLTPVAAKAATYTAPGNTAYYTCTACAKLFADAVGKTETTLEKVTIPQLIKVEEEKAEIKEEAVDTAISEAVSAGTAGDVVLDLNEVATDSAAENETPAAVISAELPVASLEKVAEISEDATLTVSMADATVVVDAAAMEAVAEQAEGTTVTLKVEQVEAETLTQTQQAAVAEHKVAKVITASFVCSEGKEIHDFQGGSVTVAMPFTPEEGTEGTDYQVLYIADDGSIEEIATTYANGTLIFTLEHFSEYVVVNTAEKNAPNNGSPATGDMGILRYAAAMLLSGTGMMAILPKKREEI